ncbi:hypothetical protein GP486_002105 [Trichoglossum hirsutum]|uniref:Metallo-beta-lactamase domain-containing protein n=1 Tax=Trichoglossum hirsutum TaxID=265104 RepID=A0A9P8RS06_9PEZI|nr:hypothetical protein GP486_002105 [Trichoglossum hirsutum]
MAPSGDQDFDDAGKNLIDGPESVVITDANGNEVWSSNDYSFIDGDAPKTVDSSLWRQSKLLCKKGLYQVTGPIFQVRGFDLSNITIVQFKDDDGSDGVIVIDPLVSKECAQAAMELYSKHYPWTPKMTKVIIYTHSHIDHYGGALGVLPDGYDGQSGTVRIIAPNGFMEHAVSENVYAGTAMTRRASYMYGDTIPKSPLYQIGTGLGMTPSSGTYSIVRPTETITENTILSIGNLDIHFQLTPGTEAPAEMNFHIIDYGALCMAENATHTMHNIQTLRGALVRDAHVWSKYLDEAIELFASKTEVVFASHHWPQWGMENVRAFLTSQRDLYAYLNDQTLRLLNEGQTGLEIAEDFELPPSLSDQWYNQGYYGSISHNVKAIYNRYMGWFDGNPAHLWELPPVQAGQLYIECFGGVDNLISKAQGYQKDNPRFAATLLSHAVFGSTPTSSSAMNALASVLTDLGYAAECGPWRNFFLVGAYELNNGIQPPTMRAPDAASMMALDLDQLMDTMAIRIDPKKSGTAAFTIYFIVSDNDSKRNPITEKILLTLSNCALTNHYVTDDSLLTPTLTCTLTHAQLVDLVMKTISIGDITNVSGDPSVWDDLMSYLTIPDPAFAIVTPERVAMPR